MESGSFDYKCFVILLLWKSGTYLCLQYFPIKAQHTSDVSSSKNFAVAFLYALRPVLVTGRIYWGFSWQELVRGMSFSLACWGTEVYFPHFVVADTKHDRLRSKTKDIGTQGNCRSWSVSIHTASLSPKSRRIMQRTIPCLHMHLGELRKLESFIAAFIKSTWFLPLMTTKFILYWTGNKPPLVLERDTASIFQMISYARILANIV